jgi:hypothetical protein
MPMPKTSVNEHDGFPAGKNNVRRTGKILAMQAKPQPQCVQLAPHDYLWLGVALTHSGHHP